MLVAQLLVREKAIGQNNHIEKCYAFIPDLKIKLDEGVIGPEVYD